MARNLQKIPALAILTTILFVLPFSAHASLININTADATTLDGLPGIGPTIANRIIEYRATNGPFATISDIQNVSGIGESTYADISALITIGAVQEDTAEDQDVTVVAQKSPGSSVYIPPPEKITISVTGPTTSFLEVPLTFSAQVKTADGDIDTGADLVWSFGDGSSNTGTTVTKIYHFSGSYVVVARAHDGPAQAEAQIPLSIASASVRISAITDTGIVLNNMASTTTDVSGWRLQMSSGTVFHIPNGMMLLGNASVLLPFVIMHSPVVLSASLLYPDGVLASAYPSKKVESLAMQPPAHIQSSISLQSVDLFSNPKRTLPKNEETAIAPTPASTLAGVGAVFYASDPSVPMELKKDESTGFFHSPWLLGLAGLITLAGGAFILL